MTSKSTISDVKLGTCSPRPSGKPCSVCKEAAEYANETSKSTVSGFEQISYYVANSIFNASSSAWDTIPPKMVHG